MQPLPAARLPGWEQRLNAVMREARDRPYVLGEHDCFRVACRVVEALTGVDRWPDFAGYTTKREALARIAAYGSTFEHAADWFFGHRLPGVGFAQRGDIVAVRDVRGEKHLGVCMGVSVYCLLADGMVALPLARAEDVRFTLIAAWGIGRA